MRKAPWFYSDTILCIPVTRLNNVCHLSAFSYDDLIIDKPFIYIFFAMGNCYVEGHRFNLAILMSNYNPRPIGPCVDTRRRPVPPEV